GEGLSVAGTLTRLRTAPGGTLSRGAGEGLMPRLIQPQIGDVLRIGLQFADFHPPDDVSEDRVGRRRDADLLALAHDKAVEERDFGAATLDHVLAGRRPVFAAAALRAGQAMLVDFLLRGGVALAGAGQRLRVHVAHLVEGVAERLADAD